MSKKDSIVKENIVNFEDKEKADSGTVEIICGEINGLNFNIPIDNLNSRSVVLNGAKISSLDNHTLLPSTTKISISDWEYIKNFYKDCGFLGRTVYEKKGKISQDQLSEIKEHQKSRAPIEIKDMDARIEVVKE